ncbi:unnamed protein product [Bursaphelenchus okinawaensis]|uniref:Histone RNA hairpin-binding protein RNA-binding domain-containing protein n=1 Tax=Bursaphelenchus okinawaensis TaxID=465554 RepID=A0A811LS02_9BILA|nr:unnamed protein product [Bursaphelenchus okinawaensis]CAG9127877.1 unnamed protein product [Bursaphelenchus okinawaensis]
MACETEQVLKELCQKVEASSLDSSSCRYGRDDLLDILYIKSDDEWNQRGKKAGLAPKELKFLNRVPGKNYDDIRALYARKGQKVDGCGDRHQCNIPEEVLARRTKELDKGKDKKVYRKYMENVPYHKRDRQCPQTPNKYQECSRRAWDAAVKQWKLDLHAWEARFDGTENDENTVTSRSSTAKSVESESTENTKSSQEYYHSPSSKAKSTSSGSQKPDKSCTQLKVMRSRAQSRQRDHTPSRDERIQWLQEARAAYSVGPTARSRAKSQSPARNKMGTITPQKRQNVFQRSLFDLYDQSDVNVGRLEAEFLNMDLSKSNNMKKLTTFLEKLQNKVEKEPGSTAYGSIEQMVEGITVAKNLNFYMAKYKNLDEQCQRKVAKRLNSDLMKQIADQLQQI